MNDNRKSFSHTLPAADPEEAGLCAAGLAKLTAIMQREVDVAHVPGVAMLIARGGKLAYRRDIGALRPGGPALPGDAIFRIYSMTKPIVSVAFMMLVEEGRLFITEPIAKYLPEFANPKVGVNRNGKLELVAAKRVTRFALRHLWEPVGAGVMPRSEVAFLCRYLFSSTDGTAVARRIDRHVDRMPGLAGLHLVTRAVDRYAPASPSTALR